MIVRIVDRGPGIPPAQLERVFEPFYRAGTPAAGTAARGSGWRSHAGSPRPTRARCTSSRCPARARRSCSSCRWTGRAGAGAGCGGSPRSRTARAAGRRSLARDPSDRCGGQREARAARRGRRRAPRVLVVDDEPQIVRALKVVLREAGFEAVPAETASEALDLRRGPPAARRRSSTWCCPTATGRGDAPAARVERDADPRALGGGRGGAEGEGARGRRRRLHHQAVRRARAGRAAAGGAAARGARPRRSRDRGGGARDRPRGARRCAATASPST